MSTTTTSKSSTKPGSEPANRLVDWAEFGVETALDMQKRWIDIASGYGDLAFKAAKDGIETFEGFYKQTRKSAQTLAEDQSERLKATLDRIG